MLKELLPSSNLKKPDTLLHETSYQNILQQLILQDENASVNKLNILSSNTINSSLVYFGYNSFFSSVYKAYADHRPIVLSPDMIWLLISQGFANHVKNNSEGLRSLFVNFNNKKELVVKADSLYYKTARAEQWQKIFPSFINQINQNIKDKTLTNTLVSNFSTTTINEKVLQGTTADWEKVLEKTKALKQYKLDWWIDELFFGETCLKNTTRVYAAHQP